MRFVNPQFLYALVAVIIPVIIHLFNLHKHRTVVFSNVTFLNQVKKSTRVQTTLKQWLILASRILAIVALVLAFAQPYISELENISPESAHSVFLDNSLSNSTQFNGLPLIEQHKSMAQSVINQLPKAQPSQLLTNDFSVASQFLYPPSQLFKMLNDVQLSSQRKDLNEIVSRQKQAFENQELNSYLISDFQKSQFNNLLSAIDSSTRYYFIPSTPTKPVNLSVDSVWFQSPVKASHIAQNIHFTITNHGYDTAFSTPIRLLVNQNPSRQISLTVPPQTSLDTFMVIRPSDNGWVNAELQTEDASNQMDNQLFFSYQVLSHLNVLEIYDDAPIAEFEAIFDKEPYFQFVKIKSTQLTKQQIDTAHFIILSLRKPLSNALSNWISTFVRNGGSVCVNPPNSDNPNVAYQEIFKTLQIPTFSNLIYDTVSISKINQKSAIYYGVLADNQPKAINYPSTYSYYHQGSLKVNAIPLLSHNRSHLLIDYSIDKGHLYKFNFGLNKDRSNFMNHNLFLPTLFQMAFISHSKPELYFPIESNLVEITSAKSNSLIEIKSINGKNSFAPQVVPTPNTTKLYLHDQITEAGHYGIWQQNDLIGYVAFNHPTEESAIDYYSYSDLKQLKDSLNLLNVTVLSNDFDEIGKQITQSQQGVPLWQFFVGLALLFLAIEIALIRYFKPVEI